MYAFSLYLCRHNQMWVKRMATKKKHYVVWVGLTPGIYDSWQECAAQVKGYAGARYKAFDTREAAADALEKGYAHYLKKASSPIAVGKMLREPSSRPTGESLAVDAACSGNPGDMEYRGVYTATGQEIFHVGPLRKGTNNIGEFLAIVHALALQQQKGTFLPVYSDSRNAISWVKQKKCKTRLERCAENEPIFNMIERAEKWLRTHTYTIPVIKWETSEWGEIPADFGRK